MVRRLALMFIVHALLATAARQTPLLRGQGMKPSTGAGASLTALEHSDGYGSLIPAQLVLTAKQSSLDAMSKDVQHNIQRTLNLSQGLRVRWFGDSDCLTYIRSHYDDELAQFYAKERIGMYRGDLCRAAVLAREGGFYTDLDVQMKEPLTSLVANDTTFMTARAAQGTILNAIMASTPGNIIILESIEEMRRRYRKEIHLEFLGPDSLSNVLTRLANENCSNLGPPQATPAWRCGSEVVRVYKEMGFECWGPDAKPKEYCPRKRVISTFFYHGAKFGLFDWNNKLVGWSRFEECDEDGCGAGGREVSTGDVKVSDHSTDKP